MYTVKLKKSADAHIREGGAWVYANEVASIESEKDDRNGALAKVLYSDGSIAGYGYINHLSKILVRIMSRTKEAPDGDFIKNAIKRAWQYRLALGYENCCRVVFSEADELPGLIVDKYADLLCIQISTLGMDRRRDEIISALTEIFSPRGIYERSDLPTRQKEGLLEFEGSVWGDFEPQAIIEENSLKLKVDLANGQKTGYFLDQKENRAAVRRYVSSDARVLDCFCNAGGFALNAAAAGAKEVFALDISKEALASVEENAALNGLTQVKTVECDVFRELRRLNKDGERYDLVVLDPPAFCKSRSELEDAKKGYLDINIQGMKLVRSGGYLVSSSCTRYMTFPLFEAMLKKAAALSGRQVKILEMKMQSPDHPSPLGEEESLYLKFFIMQVI